MKVLGEWSPVSRMEEEARRWLVVRMKMGEDGVSDLDLSVLRAVCCDGEQSSTKHPLLDEW